MALSEVCGFQQNFLKGEFQALDCPFSSHTLANDAFFAAEHLTLPKNFDVSLEYKRKSFVYYDNAFSIDLKIASSLRKRDFFFASFNLFLFYVCLLFNYCLNIFY